MSRLSTQTVLFTDLVGSTAQRAALGDDAADALQRRHDDLVRRAVHAESGRVVKGLGDGAMACFGSAADAVAAAVALQRALAAEQFDVRIGIATGDVSEQDGDLMGTPVVEASRLCAAASAGEVLVAELVRLLARRRPGVDFEPLGELELRGLPERVPVCRVLWTPAPADAEGSVPLPAPLSAAPASSYVGRRALLQELDDAWQAADAGERRTVLLAGEPGIGKTRTAAELARRVHAAGGLVLFGRCDEGMAAPYQPFVEALEAYVRGAGGSAELGRLPGELQRLVPELHTLVPERPVATDVRSEEYRLFEAVTSWLSAASWRSGLLLVLDDLHWATRPTLQLLLHVLRRLPDQSAARVLVVATYRDTDVDRAHPLVGALADLRRQPDVRRLGLTGLSVQDVLQVLGEAAGHELDDGAQALGRLLHAETEGNPFFVGEVLRHLVESGVVRRVDGRWEVPDTPDLDIPEGVRDVVGRRVSRLGPEADQVLSVAAVVGREASVDVLAAVTGLDEDRVCEALDEGVRARLLQETRADHFRFSHALVRTTLYGELSATRRRRLHRKVADVLERLHADDVVGLAHHLLEAGPEGGDVARAVRSALAAGEQSLAGRAPADAEVWFRNVLELLEDDGVGADRERLRAQVGLGRAQHDQADPAHRQTLLAASRAALAAGEVELLVEAVLANQRGYASQMGSVDVERVAVLEAALDVVGPEPTARRARLLAVLAFEASFDDPVRARALAAQAVALAEQVGDEVTAATVVAQACGPAFDPRDLHGWLALTTRAARRAQALGDPGLRTTSLLHRAAAELALGDVEQVRRTEREMVEAAAAASAGLQWAARCQALRFVVAEQHVTVAAAENDACLAVGEAAGEPDRLGWWAATVAAIAMGERGSVDHLADSLEEMARSFPDTATWACSHALGLAQAGRADAAREVLRRSRVDPAGTLEEQFPFFGPTLLGRTAFVLQDAELAQRTEQVLRPHREAWAHYFIGILGPVRLPLALCASVLGRHDEAVALAQEAVDLLDRARLPVLRWTHELDLARVRARRGDDVSPACRRLAEQAEAGGCAGVAAAARALARDRPA